MKTTVLLRYPLLEKSDWKIELIEKLISNGFQVNLIFGEKSVIKQLKFLLKEFGFCAFKKKKDLLDSHGKNLFKYFKSKITIDKVNDLNSSATEKIIKLHNPDYILLLGTGIIKSNILKIPTKGIIHCHHGLLPNYRGVNTAEWNLFFENEVYITTHFVNDGIDTGDILLRKKILLTKNDTIETLRRKCRLESVNLIIETFDKLQKNKLTKILQKKNEGMQFYSMHPFFKELVVEKIKRL